MLQYVRVYVCRVSFWVNMNNDKVETQSEENVKVLGQQLKPFKSDRVVWKEETWIASANFSSCIHGTKSKGVTRVGNAISS
jgi:hypothetical protein